MSIFKQSFMDRIKASRILKKISTVFPDDVINKHIDRKWSHLAHFDEQEIREWLSVCSQTELVEYSVATHNAMHSMSDTITEQHDWMKKIKALRFRSPLYRIKE